MSRIVVDFDTFRRTRNALDRHVYSPVGRCIYCNDASANVSLTTEHVYPAGLGGKIELPAASCKKCSTITGSFEQKLLRGTMWPARRKAGIQSNRRKKERPSTFEIKASGPDGVGEKIDVPWHKHHGVFVLPGLPPPSKMPNAPVRNGIDTIWITTLHPEDAIDALNAVQARIGRTIELGEWIDPVVLHRFVAKVAYSFAVAELGIETFSPYLLEIIMGSVAPWAGEFTGSGDPEEFGDRGDLDLIIYPTLSQRLVLTKMKLFGPYAPTYLAVVGEMRC